MFKIYGHLWIPTPGISYKKICHCGELLPQTVKFLMIWDKYDTPVLYKPFKAMYFLKISFRIQGFNIVHPFPGLYPTHYHWVTLKCSLVQWKRIHN